MNEVNFESISSQYTNILRSKYSKIFIELFSKFIDDPSFYNEAILLQNEQKNNNLFSKKKKIIFSSWYEIYLNSCTIQRTQNLPVLAFSYCYEKAKDLYLKLKKISKTKKIKFIYISRTIYKEFNTFIQLDKRTYLKLESSPKDAKFSLKNFLRLKTTHSLSLSSNSLTSSNPQNKLMNKILSETEEEKKEEKQKQNSNYINRMNKLNIFVGEYDTLLLDQVVEKTKIYDGNLCTTYFVKREVDKNIGEGKKEKEKVKRLLSDGKTIFIANDSSSNSENVFRAPFIKTSGTSRAPIEKFKFSLDKYKGPEGKTSSKNVTAANNLNFRSSAKNNSKFSSGLMPRIDSGVLNKSKKNCVPVFLLNSNKRIKNFNLKEEKDSYHGKINSLLDSDNINNMVNHKRKLSTPNENQTFQNEMRGVKFKLNINPEINSRINSSTSVLNSILRKNNDMPDEKELNSNMNSNKSPIMAKLMYSN